uniref:Chloroplast 50S ribosomal protein L35 n=1 Tax=Posidonia oceanica TaxID=55489 RepID=M1K093_POSOC|nr:chloroplast 50S ribosomal protein L35 [Posidonia oceanica]
MLLPCSPPHNLPPTRHPKPLRRSLVGLHFVPFCCNDSEAGWFWG